MHRLSADSHARVQYTAQGPRSGKRPSIKHGPCTPLRPGDNQTPLAILLEAKNGGFCHGSLGQGYPRLSDLEAPCKQRTSGTTLPCTPGADPAFAAHPAQHTQHLCPLARQQSLGLASRVRHLRTPKPIGWCSFFNPRPLASLPMQHPIYPLHPPPQLAKGANVMCR